MGGYIKLHRHVMSRPMYKKGPFDEFHAWIDLVLLAQYSDHIYVGKEVCRGTVLMPIQKLAERWGWDRRKVTRFLDRLAENGDILRESSRTTGTQIFLTHYDTEQGPDCTTSGDDFGPDGDRPPAPKTWYIDSLPFGTSLFASNGTSDGTTNDQCSCGVSEFNAQPMVQRMVQPMVQQDDQKRPIYNKDSYNKDNKKESSMYTVPPSDSENPKQRKSRSRNQQSHNGTDSIIAESGLPDSVVVALQDWTAYCRDIKKPIGQTQARILIGEVQSQVSQRGTEQVVSVIRTCIANGYKTLIWDLVDKTPAATKPAAAAKPMISNLLTELAQSSGSDYFFQQAWEQIPDLLQKAIGGQSVARSYGSMSEYDRSQAFRSVEKEYNRLLQEQNQHTTQQGA